MALVGLALEPGKFKGGGTAPAQGFSVHADMHNARTRRPPSYRSIALRDITDWQHPGTDADLFTGLSLRFAWLIRRADFSLVAKAAACRKPGLPDP